MFAPNRIVLPAVFILTTACADSGGRVGTPVPAGSSALPGTAGPFGVGPIGDGGVATDGGIGVREVDCTIDDLIAQTICAANQACRLVPPSGSATDGGAPSNGVSPNVLEARCTDTDPAGTQAKVCTSDAECARGFGCIGAGPNIKLCSRYCSPASQCSGTTSGCVPIVLGAGGNARRTGAHYCTTECDFLDGRLDCPAGTDCDVVRYNDDGVDKHATTCFEHGSKKAGERCSSDVDCEAGADCVSTPSGRSTCRFWCQPNASDRNAACPSGRECERTSPSFFVGSREVGYCQ